MKRRKMFRIGRQSVYTIMAPIARISQLYPMPLSWRPTLEISEPPRELLQFDSPLFDL
jgi:hypothetical protein